MIKSLAYKIKSLNYSKVTLLPNYSCCFLYQCMSILSFDFILILWCC